jgi:hypothetical protein
MKRKEIGRLLGDKGEGGVYVCLKLNIYRLVKNMTKNQCAPGCGLGRLGEGAVACRSRGKIGNILWGEGWWVPLHFLTRLPKSNDPPAQSRKT